MNAVFDWARGLSLPAATLSLLALNAGVLLAATTLGALASRRWSHRRVAAVPPPLSRQELGIALCSWLLNSAVTVLAWLAWRRGYFLLRDANLGEALWDFVVLLVVMDFAMYWLHRLAHCEPFLRIHRLHHAYDRPRALTLFVTHPLETIAFGLLWLAFVVLIDPSWAGLLAYLTANVLAGTLGHLGVDPLPRVPGLGTSTFHAIHHQRLDGNFGFYSDVWDRCFRTVLAPTDHGQVRRS